MTNDESQISLDAGDINLAIQRVEAPIENLMEADIDHTATLEKQQTLRPG